MHCLKLHSNFHNVKKHPSVGTIYMLTGYFAYYIIISSLLKIEHFHIALMRLDMSRITNILSKLKNIYIAFALILFLFVNNEYP